MGNEWDDAELDTTRVARERPILFSAPMIQALLAGRKTQTRRVMKRNTPFERGGCFEWYPGGEKAGFHAQNGSDSRFAVPGGWAASWCPYGKPGDRLWVRETWAVGYWTETTWMGGGEFEVHDGPIPKVRPRDWVVGYRADNENIDQRWRPSIFMPRWASRITLEITDVRVERLHDISDDDKLAEGGTPDKPFGDVWRTINTKPGIRWEDNPWVWAISFKPIGVAS